MILRPIESKVFIYREHLLDGMRSFNCRTKLELTGVGL